MASDPISEEEFQSIGADLFCGSCGAHNTRSRRLEGTVIIVNRTALAELIRKSEEAAWDMGAAAHEHDSWAVNPFAKGGE